VCLLRLCKQSPTVTKHTLPSLPPFLPPPSPPNRTQESLAEGVTKIDEVLSTWHDLKVTDRSLMWNTDLIESLELR